MKKCLFLLFSFKLACCTAQAPPIEWGSNFGGSDLENGRVIRSTADGGYITAGFTKSTDNNVSTNYGNYDAWVVKIDASGGMEWEKSIGGTADDFFYDMKVTSDGGYIACGATYSTDNGIVGHHGVIDAWVVKLSSAGMVEWQKVFGGQYVDAANCILEMPDGGFIFAADSNSNNGEVTGYHGGADYWIVRIDASGSILWQKTFGGSQADYPSQVIPTLDNGFLLVGSSTSEDGDVTNHHGNYDFWVVKINASGALEWQKAFGGTAGDLANGVVQTNDGGFIISGSTYSTNGQVIGNHGMNDVLVIKINAAGALEWQKCYGGSDFEFGHKIIKSTDGNYIIAARTQSVDGDVVLNHGNMDAWIIKINDTGQLLWQKTMGGPNNDTAFNVNPASDGGFISIGVSASATGDLSNNYGLDDFWIVKLENSLFTENFAKTAFKIFPNPAKSVVNIQFPDETPIDGIQLIDLSGKVVRQQSGSKSIDIEQLSSGLYFIKVLAGDKTYTTKFIKQ